MRNSGDRSFQRQNGIVFFITVSGKVSWNATALKRWSC